MFERVESTYGGKSLLVVGVLTVRSELRKECIFFGPGRLRQLQPQQGCYYIDRDYLHYRHQRYKVFFANSHQ